MQISEIVVISVTAFFFLFLLVKPHLSKVGFNPIEGVKSSSGLDLFMRYFSAILAFAWYPIMFFYFYYIWHDIIWVPVAEGSFRWLILAILGILFAGWAINEFDRAGWKRMKWSLIFMVSILIISEIVRYHVTKDDPPPTDDQAASNLIFIKPAENIKQDAHVKSEAAPQKSEKEKPEPKKVVEVKVHKTIYTVLARTEHVIMPGKTVIEHLKPTLPKNVHWQIVNFFAEDSIKTIYNCFNFPWDKKEGPIEGWLTPEKEPTEEDLLSGKLDLGHSPTCTQGAVSIGMTNSLRDRPVKVVIHYYDEPIDVVSKKKVEVKF